MLFLTRRRRLPHCRPLQVGSAAAAVAAYNSSWGYADLTPGRVRFARDYSATLVGAAVGPGGACGCTKFAPPAAAGGFPALPSWCALSASSTAHTSRCSYYLCLPLPDGP